MNLLTFLLRVLHTVLKKSCLHSKTLMKTIFQPLLRNRSKTRGRKQHCANIQLLNTCEREREREVIPKLNKQGGWRSVSVTGLEGVGLMELSLISRAKCMSDKTTPSWVIAVHCKKNVRHRSFKMTIMNSAFKCIYFSRWFNPK